MAVSKKASGCRDLLIVLGDQLDPLSHLLTRADSGQDIIWMAEVEEESTHVWSHKARTALFLSAMRHFAEARTKDGWVLHYQSLSDSDVSTSLAGALSQAIKQHRPKRVCWMRPGDWRVRTQLQDTVKSHDLAFEEVEDDHFYSTPDEFEEYARGRKQWRMEFFYRQMRRKHGVLMDGDKPAGGQWNYDEENRSSFGRSGPVDLPESMGFEPDAITCEVLALVKKKFSGHPGDLDHFNWPVTPEQADKALADFIAHRLPHFGRYQDAMWTDEPFLYHSLLSTALNLKLLNPRKVVKQAEAAWQSGQVSLASAEGFIRQILGWREYIRGIYWQTMPAMLEDNALEADQPLPDFYWTAETSMACMQQVIGQTLQYGYAHHIQRLMVTGLYALLLGVKPTAIHAWYLAVYVDAVEWVEAPNVFGMSQYADGGRLASKPYVASGKYIQRMSNYCESCPFDPAESTGDKACPFTTLYWDFLQRHEEKLTGNPRMTMQLKNLKRLSAEKRRAIASQAEKLRHA